ncbi:MAG: hypothetical protein LBR80_13545, partial [Deltaproteobacteria bacterium]|nr:hypothetical protein [Deltaproteobacteria bacterium]
MTGIPEYRGLANQDVRPLKAVPSASSRGGGDGGFVVSVEEFRQGINLGAGSSQDGGVPSGIPRGAPAGTAADSPLRGEPYVPKSWLRAQNGNGLSEDEKVAKLRKIRESAQEYEGLLMAEMIKQMRQKPMAKTPGSDTLSEIAEKPFTAALTAAGGLGLADKIVEDVASQEGLAGTLADHPEIMGPNWRQRIAPSRLYKPVNLGGAPGSTGAPGSPGGLRRAPDLPGGGQGLSATPRPASAPVSATASVPPEASPPMMPADPTTPVASTTATADIGDYAPASSAASGASGASRAASDIPIPAGATALKPGRNGFGNFRRGPGSPRRASGDNADADRTPSGARTPQPTHPVR